MFNYLPSSQSMNVAVLSGAGISAESGIATFRGGDGLWENHRIENVATPEGWKRDPEMMLRFYNERRAQVRAAQPNAAHLALAQLQNHHQVNIITQNIDDLHERAGSNQILHLHGQIVLARSTAPPYKLFELGDKDINMGDCCPLGSQLRPDVVWFGEDVPMIVPASKLVEQADLIMVIGTSMQVYPAAGLVRYARRGVPIYVIDPNATDVPGRRVIMHREKAGVAVPALVDKLIAGAVDLG